MIPTQLGQGIGIGWTIPVEISKRTDIDKINIYRSSGQDSGYSLLVTIQAVGTSGYVASYVDVDPAASRGMFYLVSFVSTIAGSESPYHITFFDLLPSEAVLVEQVKRTIPSILQGTLTNEDYLNGLNLAIGIFNNYPPQTYFTLQTMPKSHLVFLIGLAQMLALASRYLPLSIRDFRYSEPGGVVMDIDRGSKITEAINIITKVYTQYLPLIKLDFSADFPMALGTVQLPLSMGGVVSRGLLNILDIFTAVGR